MTPPSLRPLSVGEILDVGIKVVTRHWKPLVLSVVGPIAPLYILYVLVMASIDPDQFQPGKTFSSSSSSNGDDAAVLAGAVGSMLILAVMFVVAFAACFKAVGDAWLGGEPSAGRSVRFGLRRAPMLLLLMFVYSIPVALASLLIFPGIWLFVSWLVCIPALLFERVGPLKALGRSFSLIKGRWWASFLLAIVGYVLISMLGFIIQFGLLGIAAAVAKDSVVAGAVADTIGSVVSAAVTYPYLAAVLTILYFDQRVRKEGFDLQLAVEGFGAERDPNAPVPAPLIGDDVYTPEQRAAAPYWPPPPGWTPPPATPEWSSPTGWSAPTPGEPEDPLPPREPAADEPPPTYPGWSGRPEQRDNPDTSGRAGWLPPEAPRGPGGL